MKKYIKPSIDEINIGATMSLMQGSTNGSLTESEEPGYSSDFFAPGRKDKGDDFDEDW